jgi:hypothetical protein
MKLITELTESVEIITEGENNKNLYIKGVFLQSEQKNRNGRIYPKRILEREVGRYDKDYVKQGRAFGELGHPEGPTVNLHRASHRITELKEDGNNWIGKALIMDTDYGKTVKAILESGGKLGVSSRGMGSLSSKNGINEVQDDFYLATAADIVADPSAPDAFVEGIMENVEWVYVNETWVPQYVEESQKMMKKASRSEIEATKMKIWEGFVSKL